MYVQQYLPAVVVAAAVGPACHHDFVLNVDVDAILNDSFVKMLCHIPDRHVSVMYNCPRDDVYYAILIHVWPQSSCHTVDRNGFWPFVVAAMLFVQPFAVAVLVAVAIVVSVEQLAVAELLAAAAVVVAVVVVFAVDEFVFDVVAMSVMDFVVSD